MKTRFPNTFSSWHETHFEISSFIGVELLDDATTSPKLAKVYENEGTGGIYELAKDLTDEFELKYNGVIWGDKLDFFDTIEEFINEKLK